MSENKHAVQNRKYGNRTRLVVDGFVYHNSVIRDKPAIRYLICAHHRKFGCRARAHVPLYGDKKEIQITRAHNHPPDECAEERDLFLKQLKAASTTLPGSLRSMYASIALIYLICSKYGSTGCHARAILPLNGTIDQLRVTRAHNHPPDDTAEEKFLFFKQLKEVTQASPNSPLKILFDGVLSMYPKLSSEMSFDSIRTSMRRWRKEVETSS